LKDLVYGQAKIMEGLSRKLASTDKVLENINNKIDSFSSAMKNQLSFNKMLESQIAQLAAAIPSNEKGKILGQPIDHETVNIIEMVDIDFFKEPSSGGWQDESMP